VFWLDRREALGATALLFAAGFAKTEIMNTIGSLARAVIWRRIMDDKSFELATLAGAGAGYRIRGQAFLAQDGLPMRVEYQIDCDSGWNTRRVDVCRTMGSDVRRLVLAAEGGVWRSNGEPMPALDGCSDVDLGISPSTNALPINRLRMAVGETKVIHAAWVRFPECDVIAAEQSYERVNAARYRYKSLSSGFTALLDVDDLGLPTVYEKIWERIAVSDGAAAVGALGAGGTGFAGALIAPDPSPDLKEAADALGWLVGGWAADVADYSDDGRVRRSLGEWWFSWVLEGRAIQDVWISPPRAERGKPRSPAAADDRYGTTIRCYDAKADLWRIAWINPVSGAFNQLSGGRQGDRIVLEGSVDGTPIRWSFNDIRADSFVWRGEAKAASGDWRLGSEFRLKRMA